MSASTTQTPAATQAPAPPTDRAQPPAPPAVVGPAADAASFLARLAPSLRYLFTTEVHVFAMAIAANVLLSFIPFVVLLLTLCREVLHWQSATDAVMVFLRDALPSNQEFITAQVLALSRSHKAQAFSLGMLLFTSAGVLLPLEVALNRVWGIAHNRSFLRNQAASFGLAFGCGVLALISVLLTAAQLSAFTGWLGIAGLGGVATVLSYVLMKVVALPTTVMVFFLLYYVMPNGRVPAQPVLRAAVFAGIVTEVVKQVYMWTLPWLNFREVYGPFSVSVTLLMWAFLAALVLLLGAHFSAQTAEKQA